MEFVQERSSRAPTLPMADHQPLTPRRFNFRPSDHDLITLVLRPMVTRQQQSFDGSGCGGFIHLADVYSVAPERIAERYAPAPGTDGTWYFLCPARCSYRAAAAGAPGEGRWNSDTGEVRPVRGANGRRVGHWRTLSYGARTAAPWTTVTRHGWCMVELALDERRRRRGRRRRRSRSVQDVQVASRCGGAHGRCGARLQEKGCRPTLGGTTKRATALQEELQHSVG